MPESTFSEILAESEEITTEVNARLTLARIESDATVVSTERVIAESREFLDRVSGRSAQRHHEREHETGVARNCHHERESPIDQIIARKR